MEKADRRIKMMKKTVFGLITAVMVIMAIEPLENADTNDAKAHLELGIAYGSKGDYARAGADWEKALQLDPNHTDARNNLEALRSMGY
jgi:Tfp pilus assembly protein PilF